jgi:hypothetical protein
MRVDQRGALDGHQASRLIRARAAAQVSLPLGAANDEQQLEVEALSAGHRAPSAARLTAAKPRSAQRPVGRRSPWAGRVPACGPGDTTPQAAHVPRISSRPHGPGSDEESPNSPPSGIDADAG